MRSAVFPEMHIIVIYFFFLLLFNLHLFLPSYFQAELIQVPVSHWHFPVWIAFEILSYFKATEKFLQLSFLKSLVLVVHGSRHQIDLPLILKHESHFDLPQFPYPIYFNFANLLIFRMHCVGLKILNLFINRFEVFCYIVFLHLWRNIKINHKN